MPLCISHFIGFVLWPCLALSISKEMPRSDKDQLPLSFHHHGFQDVGPLVVLISAQIHHLYTEDIAPIVVRSMEEPPRVSTICRGI
jgi:hypothetical protein